MRQINEYTEYQNIVDRYRRPGCHSNDYLQNDVVDIITQDSLYVDYYENNVFLYVQRPVGMRVYYYINDFEEAADFSQYNDLVIEILFRGECPNAEVAYFTTYGFHENLIRDQYNATYRDLNLHNLENNIVVQHANTPLGVQQACELFNEVFDRLSGDYIPECDYERLFNTRSILIAWNQNRTRFLGALHQEKTGVVNVIGHVAVMSHSRGKGVGKALVNAFIQNNMETERTRYQLWVQRQNNPAVRMYQNYGFRYTNKSTISLIK